MSIQVMLFVVLFQVAFSSGISPNQGGTVAKGRLGRHDSLNVLGNDSLGKMLGDGVCGKA